MKKDQIYKGQFFSALGVGILFTLFYPTEMVRTRLQTTGELFRQKKIDTFYAGIRDCTKRIYKYEGFRAFWKGNATSLLRHYPNEACNFISKEIILYWLRKSEFLPEHHSYVFNFLSAVLGSWIAFFIIYPFEFSRNQLANDIQGRGTLRSVLRETFASEGFRGVYRGGLVNFYMASVARCLYFGVFDTVKQYSPTFQAKLVGSYISSFLSSTVCYPVDTIRRRLIMTSGQDYKYDGFVDCWRYVYQKEGFMGFYRGFSIVFVQSFCFGLILMLNDKIATDFKTLNSIQD